MNIAIVSAVLHGSEFIDFILVIYDILLSKNLYSHYFKSKREDQTKKNLLIAMMFLIHSNVIIVIDTLKIF